jgi:hypothetical protein
MSLAMMAGLQIVTPVVVVADRDDVATELACGIARDEAWLRSESLVTRFTLLDDRCMDANQFDRTRGLGGYRLAEETE